MDQGRGLIYQFGHDALKLESADASTIGIKLVKGFMRYHFDLLIPRERTIDVNLQRQATFAEVQRGFDPIRARFALAPAGEAYRIVSEIGAGSLRWEVLAMADPCRGSVWSFVIWDHFPLVASVIDDGMAEALETFKLHGGSKPPG